MNLEQGIDEKEEVQEVMPSMADFMDEIDKSMTYLSKGELIKGTVVGNNGENLIINIGHMADGIVPKEEVDFDGGDSITSIHIGDEITCHVLKTDDGEGNVLLSKKRADAELAWDQSAGLANDQRPVTVRIKETVKGGVIAMYKGIRMFIPLSQVGVERVEDPETLVGKELQVIITEVDEDKKSMIASGRLLQEKQIAKRRDARFYELKEGQIITGTVTRLTDFGAFVDLGGIDGLIHLSELSWKRVHRAEEVVSVGEMVKVSIIKIDAVNQKVGLRLADIADNPWDDINSHFSEGDVVEGRVTRLQAFGAFVELKEGIEGLVHISQIAEERISKPQERLSVGQTVKVMVLGIDEAQKRISLSIKEALSAELDAYAYEYDDSEDQEESTTLGDLFAEKLKGLKF